MPLYPPIIYTCSTTMLQSHITKPGYVLSNILFINLPDMKPSLQSSQTNPLCMAPLWMERRLWLTPNRVLTAHASVVCQVQDCSMAVLPVPYTQGRIEMLVVGWAVVAQWLEHWWFNPVTWVRFWGTPFHLFLPAWIIVASYIQGTSVLVKSIRCAGCLVRRQWPQVAGW